MKTVRGSPAPATIIGGPGGLRVRGRAQSSQPRAIVVLVTCPTKTVARRLATALIKRRLAACVNLVPQVESVFWWQGKIDRVRESLLVIKTTQARFAAMKNAITALHPYDVPEIIALPITAGHRPYLDWVASSVKS